MVDTSGSSVQPETAVAATPVSRRLAGYRSNLVTALLSVWFTIGLFVDAWAHNNLLELETFFTPWHALFYSGFAATAGWIAWTIRPALRQGWPNWKAMPVGYGPAAVALAGFALAGAGDGTWHTVFGVEQQINILFSPTHLGLAVSMFVIVTTPLRAMWADGSLPAAPSLRQLLPAVLSAALAATLVLLFLLYANAFGYSSGGVALALSDLDEGLTTGFVSSMAVTTAVLITTLLTVARRWRLPFGTATILHMAVGGLSGAVLAFENLDLVVAVVAAGACVDLLASWLRPAPAQLRAYRAFGALAPLLTWSIFIVTAALTAPPLASRHLPGPDGSLSPPEAVVELYTGTPVAQALIGLLIAVLLVPDRRAARPPAG
jgi:hypothetical protein